MVFTFTRDLTFLGGRWASRVPGVHFVVHGLSSSGWCLDVTNTATGRRDGIMLGSLEGSVRVVGPDTPTMDIAWVDGDAAVETRLDLVDEPGCSALVVRAGSWDGRADAASVSFGLDGMRALRDSLDEQVARVEAHDAVLNAAADADAAEVRDAASSALGAPNEVSEDADGM